MGLYEDLNRAGLLAIGLKPEWVDQDATAANYTGAPNAAADGVFLQNSPKALVQVNARESAHRRTGRVQITTADLTTTVYTVTIDGFPVVYDASVETPFDLAALVAGIAAKIEADASATLVVDAVTDPENPDTVLITGKAEADWSLDATVAGGTGAVSATADATGFDVRIWTTPGGVVKSGSTGKPNGWASPVDAVYSGRDYRGFVERLDVAGLERLYVELFNITNDGSDGAAVSVTIDRVMVGPAVLEATS